MSRTLADMTPAERQECVGMWGTLHGSTSLRPVIIWDVDGDIVWRLSLTWHELIGSDLDLVTPRFDLPRAWTPSGEPEPESTPGHPTELTTEAEYRNAPEGTIVAAEDKEAWTKGEDGSWETWGIISGYNNYVMADGPRRVLRWGWGA